MLFELLDSGTLQSQTGVFGGNTSGQSGRKVAFAQGRLLKVDTGMHEMDVSGWGTFLDMQWLQLSHEDTTEREPLCLLNVEHWKAQQKFEQDGDSLGVYTIQRQNDKSCSETV